MGRNQKGFSLVELVVVIAILSILGTALYGFFHTSITSYRDTSREADLQRDAQMATNQLDNLIIDSTLGLTYKCTLDTGEEKDVSKDDAIANPESITKKELKVVNEDANYYVTWTKADKKILMTKEEKTIDEHGNALVNTGEPALLAENVEKFGVNLERTTDDRVVGFDFKFADTNREYSTRYNITLRNKVVVNEKNGLNKPVTGSDQIVIIRAVEIFNGSENWTNKEHTYLMTGAEHSVNLEAKLSGVDLVQGQEVEWSISGAEALKPNTRIVNANNTSCQVVIAGDEQCHRIFVDVKAKEGVNCDTNTARTTIVMMEVGP